MAVTARLIHLISEARDCGLCLASAPHVSVGLDLCFTPVALTFPQWSFHSARKEGARKCNLEANPPITVDAYDGLTGEVFDSRAEGSY
ncbi:DevR family CRISPR-associated autoregulator [Sesbania bispinosa]|nr:DevR family CRISPR-associated autoregulator [Sesbania bispinosa]